MGAAFFILVKWAVAAFVLRAGGGAIAYMLGFRRAKQNEQSTFSHFERLTARELSMRMKRYYAKAHVIRWEMLHEDADMVDATESAFEAYISDMYECPDLSGKMMGYQVPRWGSAPEIEKVDAYYHAINPFGNMAKGLRNGYQYHIKNMAFLRSQGQKAVGGSQTFNEFRLSEMLSPDDWERLQRLKAASMRKEASVSFDETEEDPIELETVSYANPIYKQAERPAGYAPELEVETPAPPKQEPARPSAPKRAPMPPPEPEEADVLELRPLETMRPNTPSPTLEIS